MFQQVRLTLYAPLTLCRRLTQTAPEETILGDHGDHREPHLGTLRRRRPQWHPDLVEVIKLQGSGPTEAARAIRKKLKYGNVHRQIRALVLLDGLIQNAGPRFQRMGRCLNACASADLRTCRIRLSRRSVESCFLSGRSMDLLLGLRGSHGYTR